MRVINGGLCIRAHPPWIPPMEIAPEITNEDEQVNTTSCSSASASFPRTCENEVVSRCNLTLDNALIMLSYQALSLIIIPLATAIVVYLIFYLGLT